MGAITKNGERGGAEAPPQAPRSLSSSSPDCSPEVETKGCSFFYENKQNHLTSRQRLLPRFVLFFFFFAFFFLIFLFFPSPFLLFRRRCSCPGRRRWHHGDSSAEPPRDEASPASGGSRLWGGFGGLGGGTRCRHPLPAVPPVPKRGFRSRAGSSAPPELGLFLSVSFFFYPSESLRQM